MPKALAILGGKSVSAQSFREDIKQDTTECMKSPSPSPTQKIRKIAETIIYDFLT